MEEEGEELECEEGDEIYGCRRRMRETLTGDRNNPWGARYSHADTAQLGWARRPKWEWPKNPHGPPKGENVP